MLDQLCADGLQIVRAKCRGAARVGTRIERSGLSSLLLVPPDRVVIDPEHPSSSAFAHASFDCCQYLGTQVGGVRSHTSSLLPRNYLENCFSSRGVTSRTSGASTTLMAALGTLSAVKAATPGTNACIRA